MPNPLFRRITVSSAIIGFCMSLAPAVYSHDEDMGPEPTGIVKERMEEMKKLKTALLAVKKTLTEGEFDQTILKTNGEAISKFAGEPLLKFFPEGTNEAPSEALDNIWTEWEDFKVKSALLKTKADALAGSEGKEAGMAAFGEMAQSCGGCHKKFRLQKEQ